MEIKKKGHKVDISCDDAKEGRVEKTRETARGIAQERVSVGFVSLM